MRLFNNKTKYGLVAIVFHWITFFILLFQIPLGFYLEDLEFSDFKMSVEYYHSILGVIIFYIILFRLIWKSLNASPLDSNQVKSWQLVISKINHWLLYVSLLTISISGILKKLLSGEEVNFLFKSVSLDYFNFEIVNISERVHSSSVILLIVLIIIHILAVVYHHIFLKEPILKKIS